ncbi:hypothetical protein EDC04DRAFT_2806688 [Pisolithus marmoratus]|nr:hypothetical protein EDC04DRAFT_2806688 [Pisolithus marmoratus]
MGESQNALVHAPNGLTVCPGTKFHDRCAPEDNGEHVNQIYRLQCAPPIPYTSTSTSRAPSRPVQVVAVSSSSPRQMSKTPIQVPKHRPTASIQAHANQVRNQCVSSLLTCDLVSLRSSYRPCTSPRRGLPRSWQFPVCNVDISLFFGVRTRCANSPVCSALRRLRSCPSRSPTTTSRMMSPPSNTVTSPGSGLSYKFSTGFVLLASKVTRHPVC